MNAADYDVVIIGGGIHGCGCAQAAAAAGYRALVIEQTGIAAATSSRSSKLIHGGLRYLESFQFSLVAESLRERQLLLDNAPDLVNLTPFYIPVYSNGLRKAWKIHLGLALYALLGRYRASTRFRRIEKHKWQELDNINKNNLVSVFQYHDGQTDDIALTQAVMRSAQSLGAELCCPARFLMANYEHGTYTLSVIIDNNKRNLTTKTLINASGPWVNRVLANTTPRIQLLDIDLVQGSHVVLNQPSYQGVYYVEAEDGRAVFIMPWKGKTMVGTTEKIYQGDPSSVSASDEEVGYLVRTAQRFFPDMDTTEIERFAGLRTLPRLPGTAFHRPRDTLLHASSELPGMISIVGGKLTGYRATAEKVMELIKPLLPATTQKTDTQGLLLSGGN